MLKEHKKIQKWIQKKYSSMFDIYAEALKGQNNLPDKKRHIYRPDVIIRKKDSHMIVYIIEVENDPTRKNIVGASILSDYCIGTMQHFKPVLLFIVYNTKGINQIHNFIEKINIAKEYCSHLKDIQIYPINEFKKLKL